MEPPHQALPTPRGLLPLVRQEQCTSTPFENPKSFTSSIESTRTSPRESDSRDVFTAEGLSTMPIIDESHEAVRLVFQRSSPSVWAFAVGEKVVGGEFFHHRVCF